MTCPPCGQKYPVFQQSQNPNVVITPPPSFAGLAVRGIIRNPIPVEEIKPQAEEKEIVPESEIKEESKAQQGS